MKRLMIAVVLLALTVILCFINLHTLSGGTERLLSALSDIEIAFEAGGVSAATPYVTRFDALVPEETRWFPLFLPHEHVEAMEESAALLPILLETDTAAFQAELNRCRSRLTHLQESERLTIENLL